MTETEMITNMDRLQAIVVKLNADVKSLAGLVGQLAAAISDEESGEETVAKQDRIIKLAAELRRSKEAADAVRAEKAANDPYFAFNTPMSRTPYNGLRSMG